ncbi:metal ABC transporter substrate-binding protein, partial [Treponema sp. R8-4-B8]
LPPGAESHSYEPSPKDIITIKNSGVFIYGGGEGDAWVDRILESMDTSKMTIVRMMDAVDAVEEEIVEGMEEEAKPGEEEIAYDEHVWTSPRNALLIVGAITAALCKADSANAEFYSQNAVSFGKEWVRIAAPFKAIIAGPNGKTTLFATRFPFRTFR